MAVGNLRYRLSLLFVPLLYRALSALIFGSCRVKEYNRQAYDRCLNKRPFIAAVWHYSVFFAINSMRGLDWVAMVSASKDAEYISQLLNRMGFLTVRGSKGKGGLRAIKEMVAILNEQKRNAAIIADGSQGPPRIVQAGAILLASKTGAPILPTAWSASRYKAFKSWDRTVLPMPFARIAVCYGEPLIVPPDIKAVDIEKYRLDLESRINDIYHKAWQIFDKEEHDK